MRRRFLIPETVQTSSVDCGAAALVSLLGGFGIPASYGRLREACRTAVDGTSVDTVEIIANDAGLLAEQVMLPPDYLLLGESNLPAVVIVRLPTGYTHFVVVWREVGPYVQVMDPAVGRRWMKAAAFLSSVYLHEHEVPAADWLSWATSEEALLLLSQSLERAGGPEFTAEMIARTVKAGGWRPLARLDAVARMGATLVRNGAVGRGADAERIIAALMTLDESGQYVGDIPRSFWSVVPSHGVGEEEQVALRGAVLVRIRRGPEIAKSAAAAPEIAAALAQPVVRPLKRLYDLLSPASRRAVPLTIAAASLVGVTAIAQGLLFRSMFKLLLEAGATLQQMIGTGVLAVFAILLVGLDFLVSRQAVAWGREVEARLAAAFLSSVASLRNDYFASRAVSDMAERIHAVAELRTLPFLVARGVRSSSAFVLTTIALMCFTPDAAITVIVGAAALLMIAVAMGPLYAEFDLRTRTHVGGLTRFYLDSLAALHVIHAHCAERVVRREHEALLTETMRAQRRQITAAVQQSLILAAAGLTTTALLIWHYVGSAHDASGVLLIAYWALNLPALAGEIAQGVQALAGHRSVALRLFEPVDAPRDESPAVSEQAPPASEGVSIEFRGAAFAAAGHDILSPVDLTIRPGSYVGVVGPSGAGKSTLVGALLGWMRPREGVILLDGQPLDSIRLATLRRDTVWVDPSVQLFNTSLESNLTYASGSDLARFPFALDAADLHTVLSRLPHTRVALGESGGSLSGGEGQRVRLGRGLIQAHPRLVILDEAFRGLDGATRQELLRRCRSVWSGATFLFVTHDVEETLECDEVVVLQGGRVVELGSPGDLMARDSSQFNQIRSAARRVRDELWKGRAWQRIELHDGRIESAS